MSKYNEYNNYWEGEEGERAREIFYNFRGAYYEGFDDVDEVEDFVLDFEKPLVLFYYIGDDSDYELIPYGVYYITKDIIFNYNPNEQNFESFVRSLPKLKVPVEYFSRSRISDDAKGAIEEYALDKLINFIGCSELGEDLDYITVEDKLRFLKIPYDVDSHYYFTISVEDFIYLNEKSQIVLHD